MSDALIDFSMPHNMLLQFDLTSVCWHNSLFGYVLPLPVYHNVISRHCHVVAVADLCKTVRCF